MARTRPVGMVSDHSPAEPALAEVIRVARPLFLAKAVLS